MIKLSEILIALNTQLKGKFPDVEIDSKDLSEKFNRPSFRSSIDNLNTSKLTNKYKEREFTIRIYYFTRKPKLGRLERLEVIERLEELLLNDLRVSDAFVLPVSDLDFYETGEGVLIASFDTCSFEEIIDDRELPEMEELEIRR